jgi:hypothetical protein
MMQYNSQLLIFSLISFKFEHKSKFNAQQITAYWLHLSINPMLTLAPQTYIDIVKPPEDAYWSACT